MATKRARKVVLAQVTVPIGPTSIMYRVTQLVNLVKPRVGECLTERDVNALIERDIQVTIRTVKR